MPYNEQGLYIPPESSILPYMPLLAATRAQGTLQPVHLHREDGDGGKSLHTRVPFASAGALSGARGGALSPFISATGSAAIADEMPEAPMAPPAAEPDMAAEDFNPGPASPGGPLPAPVDMTGAETAQAPPAAPAAVPGAPPSEPQTASTGDGLPVPAIGQASQQAQGVLSQQPQQQPFMSNALQMGLLSAGLGILANNTGQVPGQSAVGRGGLLGVQTYLSVKQNEAKQQQALIVQAFHQQQLAEQARLHDAQIGRYAMENKKTQQEVTDKEEAAKASADVQRAYPQLLKHYKDGTIPMDQALVDPGFHRMIGNMYYASNNPKAAKIAMDSAQHIEDERVKARHIEEVGVPGNPAQQVKKVVDVRDGSMINIPGAEPREIHSNKSLVDLKVNSYVPASEEAQKEYIKETRVTYNALKFAPTMLRNLDQAEEVAKKAIMGSGASAKINFIKFFNNNLGTHIDHEGVSSAEELRTRLYVQIMENLKKLDASPSQQQETMMHDALGRLENDPQALPRVLNVYREIVTDKVAVHNKDVEGAIKNGVKFPYDPRITMPPPKAKIVGQHLYMGRTITEYDDGTAKDDQGNPVKLK